MNKARRKGVSPPVSFLLFISVCLVFFFIINFSLSSSSRILCSRFRAWVPPGQDVVTMCLYPPSPLNGHTTTAMHDNEHTHTRYYIPWLFSPRGLSIPIALSVFTEFFELTLWRVVKKADSGSVFRLFTCKLGTYKHTCVRGCVLMSCMVWQTGSRAFTRLTWEGQRERTRALGARDRSRDRIRARGAVRVVGVLKSVERIFGRPRRHPPPLHEHAQ